MDSKETYERLFYGMNEETLERIVWKGRVLIPRHNVLTEFYSVKNHRRFPVAERMMDETFQVQAFALYDERAVEQVLDRFHAFVHA